MWGCIYFVVFVQRKKKSEIKRRNKIPQEKKKKEKMWKRKRKKNSKNRVIFLYCFNFNKRLEENKSCFGYSIGMSFKVVDLSCKHVKHFSFRVLSSFTIHHLPFILLSLFHLKSPYDLMIYRLIAESWSMSKHMGTLLV